GERANDVDVNRADFGVALIAQIIASGFDVVRGAAERDEHGIGIVGLVFVNQTVITSSQVAKLFISLFKNRKNVLVEIIAARHHTVHVMLLILHGAQQNRVLQVHHFRHATPLGAEQFTLRWRGTFNHIISAAKIFTEQLGFRREIGALAV